ncbi:MAG TPA: UDP-2,3-diacylglucosamine diphosphatase [Methylophilaceae bacterium]|nr:UDP-2,3-diacylglucosamine diphosphatase [Methylophilaceae bacterium]HAJ70550.1 UDP-2,3-diacylglucosamine diphosphatase [Methylophilaceae bacterium]
MGFTLFISDLHLCQSRPHVTTAFLSWLKSAVVKADALYILGDFFEYWLGDDAIEKDFHRPIIVALHEITQLGIPVYLMHGNRDFLIGTHFLALTGTLLIEDPSHVQLYGKSVVLTHGDTMCTDDVGYMAFRETVRNPLWQNDFLGQSIENRLAYAQQARVTSSAEKSLKNAEIMDVNSVAVNDMLRRYSYPAILIHGHTHRPARHDHEVDGHVCQRYVLGDWYDQGSYLKMNADTTIEINRV